MIFTGDDFMKLTSEIVEKISKIKNEPDWMREFRVRAFECFDKMDNPDWGPEINVPPLHTAPFKAVNLFSLYLTNFPKYFLNI